MAHAHQPAAESARPEPAAPESEAAAEQHASLTAEDDAEMRRSSAERMTYFSDAVVAIAITLLALSLPVPHGKTNSELWHSLASNWSQYSVFLISFLVIWLHWTSHRRLFRYVIKLSPRVSRYNMVWLLGVVITPFATRVMTLHSSATGVRFTVYAAVQILGWVSLLLMTRELARTHSFRPGTPVATGPGDPLSSFVAIGLFTLSIPLSFVTPWAFILWLITGPVTAVVRRIAGNRVPATGRDGEV